MKQRKKKESHYQRDAIHVPIDLLSKGKRSGQMIKFS